jgi:hypothetical protein
MGARDKTEEILRKIHVYFATAEPYFDSKKKIVVDKQEFLDILKELNASISDMMDEYEVTLDSRDKADLANKKKAEAVRREASRDADDIYAASIIYTDQSLKKIERSIEDARRRMNDVIDRVNDILMNETKEVNENHLELMSRLESMRDTKKYLRIIQDENKRIAEEEKKLAKEKENIKVPEQNRDQPEIKVNTEYLKRLGISLQRDDKKEDQ